MKKVIVLILCMSMMVGLTACSNVNKEKDNDNKPKETKETQEIEETEETEETEEANEKKEVEESKEEETEKDEMNSEVEFAPYPYTQRTPRISIETPVNYMAIEQGYTQMFNVGRDKSISLVCHLDYTTTSLEDAHDAAFEKYIQGFQNYADIETLTAEKEEVIEINGREMYHFEGELNCSYNETEYNLYCTGYSFIMDDIPCMLIGTVLEWEKDQEMIDEVKMYTDAMIQTVKHRDEE